MFIKVDSTAGSQNGVRVKPLRNLRPYHWVEEWGEVLALVFFGLSLAFLGFGIYRLRGPVSVWYLAYGIYAGGLNYFSIPFGVVMALWALALSPFIPDDWKLWLFNIGTISGLLGVILARFLKPRWLRWLEREHGKIIPLLRNEIQEIGYHEWDQRINTQQDLEQWVSEVQRKHKLEER